MLYDGCGVLYTRYGEHVRWTSGVLTRTIRLVSVLGYTFVESCQGGNVGAPLVLAYQITGRCYMG